MAKLTLIGVPIGNLKDLTDRAKHYLLEKDNFLAEDGRNFKKLCRLIGRKYPCSVESFFEHNCDDKLDNIIERMNQGEDFCLVSNAGSAIISDPAFPLVKMAIDNGHNVETIPGVSSVITSLELSGLPPIPFYFWGFLPRTNRAIEQLFKDKFKLKGTHIFFQSPKRIYATLEILSELFPKIKVVVARELTKKFESVYRFCAMDFKKIFVDRVLKGEVVLLVYAEWDFKNDISFEQLSEMASQYLKDKKKRTLAKILGKLLGKNTEDIYLKI